jgi:3',5'-cyclic AMP phosphodiesterase CpdA
MAFKLIQISDTISVRVRRISTPIERRSHGGQHPDLVIHTGDVTVDGADIKEDFRYAAELMHGSGVRFRAVPGNHDVGDPDHDHQPVNEERLERWRAHFGPDRWVEDVENWRLIGLNALLLGSGDREEALQAFPSATRGRCVHERDRRFEIRLPSVASTPWPGRRGGARFGDNLPSACPRAA